MFRWQIGFIQRWEKEHAIFKLHDARPLPRAIQRSYFSEFCDFCPSYIPVAALLAKLRGSPAPDNDHGIDPLLKDAVFPSVLKRFNYAQGGIDKIGAILRRLQGRQSRVAFDAYLAQACQDGVLEPILPNLSLVNQRGQWVAASRLIWPSTNLDLAAQLCTEQAEILASLHHGLTDSESQTIGSHQDLVQVKGHELSGEPDFEAQVDTLAQYLQPFRNGNVGEPLPAALVAVLGGHPKNLVLLQELLQAGTRQQPDDFLAMLVGEHGDFLIPAVRGARFLIEIVRGGAAEATTITGAKIMVDFTREVATLLVGDPSDLWRCYYYHSRTETACHRLRLRWIENPDELPDPVAVFASTIETIFLKAHCNGVSKLCPQI